MAAEPDLSAAAAPPKPLGIVGRGFCMGIAEVVPGVSGGTIAFVTGIYQTLISSIASFGPQSLLMLRDWPRFVAHHQLNFLLWLALGMGLGVLVFAQLMQYLLLHYQPVIWGFFSGVISMSVLIIGRARARSNLLLWLPIGVLGGLGLLWMPQLSIQPSLWLIFFGGALAVCAWLLPAVSGSFVLLALGLYAPVINALADFDIPVLVVLAAGCTAGLLLFSRLLAWLLQTHGDVLLSLLCGFMLGSLGKLWPWQNADAGTGWQALLSPQTYQAQLAEPALLFWVVLFWALGALGLWALSKVTVH
ncbi:MAG: DUF368 domain-containing protein [Pseudomonadota bacterium]